MERVCFARERFLFSFLLVCWDNTVLDVVDLRLQAASALTSPVIERSPQRDPRRFRAWELDVRSHRDQGVYGGVTFESGPTGNRGAYVDEDSSCAVPETLLRP